MLRKAARLTAPEVRAILHHGRKVRAPGLSATYVVAKSPRFAVVVSKKVAKTAVGRNKLRRAAYATLKNTPLPKVNAVVFLHTAALKPQTLQTLCSQLS